MSKITRIVAGGLLAAGVSAANAAIIIQASNVPFVDISGTGATVPGAISDDSEHTVVTGWVGNGLFAGGTNIRIGNNGAILWGNAPADAYAGATEAGYYNAGPNNVGDTSIATMTAANGSDSGNGANLRQYVMPLWDDYVPVSGGATSSVRWQVIGNDLIVQWNREDAFAATGSGDVTFEAIFRGGVAINSGASLVDFVYQDTLFQVNQYQNDGGSATIGYKNWGLNANANDVEFGVGGGGTSSTSDPAFNGLGMQPKVGGWVANANPNLTHSVSILPEPASLSLIVLAGLGMLRRR
jgi:hypothetical protein